MGEMGGWAKKTCGVSPPSSERSLAIVAKLTVSFVWLESISETRQWKGACAVVPAAHTKSVFTHGATCG